ncbi:MAG: porin [Gammaproteobacteria bacterium]
MINHNKLIIAAVGASAALSSGAASAVEFQTSDWTFSATGNVNVHYIYTMCDDSPDVVAGSLLCGVNSVPDPVTGLGVEDDNSSSIGTGLLPAAVVFGASTTQNDIDIGTTIGFYPGVATNDFGPNGPNLRGDLFQPGLGTTNMDIRQVFLTFGNETMGTFKFGRDFGLFGFDAIINDMTIPGVGPATNATARAPANTTLGSIGYGYIYTDTPTQINYQTPSIGGLTGTIGIFQPYDSLNLSGLSSGTTGSTSEEPGFHGKLAYEWAGGVPGFVSGSFITQDATQLTFADAVVKDNERAWAADVTAKATFGGLDVLGSYYTTKGWGHTGFLFDGFDPTGEARDSDGYLAQVTYTIANTKFGVNYGVNSLDANAVDTDPTLLDENSKYTLGVYHNLTPNLTLLAEYSDAESENQEGGTIETENFNVGAFVAF